MGLAALVEMDPDQLNYAMECFDAAGNYQEAKSYRQYIMSLQDIFVIDSSESVNLKTTVYRLQVLDELPEFVASLAEHNLPACQSLITYITARQMEASGDYATAWHLYAEIYNVLDALDRRIGLSPMAYCQGKEALAQGDYQTAKDALQGLKWEDSEALYKLAITGLNLKLHIGDHFTFGHYPQTSDGTDITPIEWIVLDIDIFNLRAFVISRYALDTQPYNTEKTDVTWETCTLRTWLNNDFLNTAFTAEEQTAITITDVDNSKSQGYCGYVTNSGNNTQDKIFLLSFAEVHEFFGSSDLTRRNYRSTLSRVFPTEYALAQGAYISKPKGIAPVFCWLRSPGSVQWSAMITNEAGGDSVFLVDSEICTVRPAFYIDLDSGVF